MLGPRALLDERVQLLEFRRSGALEPLEHDHFGVNDIDAFLGEPGHRALAILLGARAHGIGDHESLETLSLEVDRGLHHAHMSLDPGEDDLRPALTAKLMQPLA